MSFILRSFAEVRSLIPPGKLSRNIGANLAGTAWNGLLIVLATPLLVSRLGMEGYGLVGFWLLMQVIFSLFDLGLGATLVREFAASADHPDGASRRKDLLRTLEWVYWPLAFLLTILLFISAEWIAHHWLKLVAIPPESAARALRWMAIALGLQFPCALYSSGLAGLQLQGRMNALQMAGNTLRYGGGVTLLLWRADLSWFFLYQALIAGIQTLVIQAVLRHSLGETEGRSSSFRRSLISDVWRFSAGMAITMVAGILLANVDRLFLSKLLPAAELGKYTLAWTVAGFLQFGIQPFYRAFYPRFAELHALGDRSELRREYYLGCRLAGWLIIPFALLGLFFAREIFQAWLGRADDTPVLVFRWLLLGVAGAGLMWLPAAFQQAQGWTRLHASMIVGALLLGLPLLWWAIQRWGTVGATAVWVLHGVSDLTLGMWLMHKRLLAGELLQWYRAVILQPLLLCFPIVMLSWLVMPAELRRWPAAIWIGITGILEIVALLVHNATFRKKDKAFVFGGI